MLPSILFFLMIPPPPRSTLFPYTTLFRSTREQDVVADNSTDWRDDFVISPGVRVAFNFASGLQIVPRSEEHTSELQSRFDLVCRLLLEKKKIFYHKLFMDQYRKGLEVV